VVVPYTQLKNLDCRGCPKLYLPRALQQKWRPDEKFLPHPYWWKMVNAIVVLNKHLPVLQRKFLERMYAPDSNYYNRVLGPHLRTLEKQLV
jgi:hypothetical protein